MRIHVLVRMVINQVSSSMEYEPDKVCFIVPYGNTYGKTETIAQP
jgi:hypothetical protein